MWYAAFSLQMGAPIFWEHPRIQQGLLVRSRAIFVHICWPFLQIVENSLGPTLPIQMILGHEGYIFFSIGPCSNETVLVRGCFRLIPACRFPAIPPRRAWITKGPFPLTLKAPVSKLINNNNIIHQHNFSLTQEMDVPLWLLVPQVLI